MENFIPRNKLAPCTPSQYYSAPKGEHKIGEMIDYDWSICNSYSRCKEGKCVITNECDVNPLAFGTGGNSHELVLQTY